MSFLWEMRAAAVGWLRFDYQCPLVCWERSPLPGPGRPDLIGVEPKRRRVIEVEFKQSMADFRANAAKHSVRWREAAGVGLPWQFYFAVPRELADRVRAELPPRAGLLTLGQPHRHFGPQVVVVVRAKPDPRSVRLTLYEAARMAAHQTATLHRCCRELAKLR